MMAPFNHGDLRQIAFEDPIIPSCDLILAITGPYWFRTVKESRCSHWRPKMIHLDLAIDRGDFPPVKTSFAAPGERRVVYIGHSGSFKNTSHLSEIAALVPDAEFAWMGTGARPIPGLTALGQIDFASQSGKDLVSQFDFLLTVGNADANPTTILEAMAWGLIPICTPTSGYDGIPSIPNVPVDDAAAAAAVVRGLLFVNEPDLLAMQSANWRLLHDHYNWDRFAAQVAEAIESTESPHLGPESLKRRVMFTFYDITSPYGRLGRVASKFRRRYQTLRTLNRTSAERQFQKPSE
jgi:glycosyltransferase involved in cell wall biosynthesis